jgi:hypothetical protein
MNPQQFIEQLATTGSNATRNAIRATVQTVNPILGAIMLVLRSAPNSYHRHADKCPCTDTDMHDASCVIAILEPLSDGQKAALYRFACHVFAPPCPYCARETGLVTSGLPSQVGQQRRPLELD